MRTFSTTTLASVAVALIAMATTAQPVAAWSAAGHMIAAQIAYNAVPVDVQKRLDAYINFMQDTTEPDKPYAGQPWTFAEAATWMDQLKSQDFPFFGAFHIYDTPYTELDDKAKYDFKTVMEEGNIVFALAQVNATLHNMKCSVYHEQCGKALRPTRSSGNHRSSPWTSALSLRMLTHLIGDLHCPLHNVDRYNKFHKHGDAGGNQFRLAKQKTDRWSPQLHGFWDEVGKLYDGDYHVPLTKKAHDTVHEAAVKFAAEYPRDSDAIAERLTNTPFTQGGAFFTWHEESGAIAKRWAYNNGVIEDPKNPPNPDADYTDTARKLCAQQLALAGYRLYDILMSVFDNHNLPALPMPPTADPKKDPECPKTKCPAPKKDPACLKTKCPEPVKDPKCPLKCPEPTKCPLKCPEPVKEKCPEPVKMPCFDPETSFNALVAPHAVFAYLTSLVVTFAIALVAGVLIGAKRAKTQQAVLLNDSLMY